MSNITCYNCQIDYDSNLLQCPDCKAVTDLTTIMDGNWHWAEPFYGSSIITGNTVISPSVSPSVTYLAGVDPYASSSDSLSTSNFRVIRVHTRPVTTIDGIILYEDDDGILHDNSVVYNYEYIN